MIPDQRGPEHLGAGPEGVQPGQQVDGDAALVLAGCAGGEEVAVVGGGVDVEVAVVAGVDAVGAVAPEA